MNPKAKNSGPVGKTFTDPADGGIFLIDKPAGPSSFRVVQQVRRALRIKKVGHAGTWILSRPGC